MSRKRLRPWIAAGIALLAVTSNVVVAVDVANADVCASVGRRVSVSGCTNVADTIRGKAGDDILVGARGNDNYVYARGDGHDTINEGYDDWGDRLTFTDVNAAAVSLVRNGSDVTIVIAESSAGAGNGGSVLLKQSLEDDGGRGVEVMVPDRRPGPAQITVARRPGIGGIEIEADDRIGQPEFGILLDQVRDLIAGKVATDHVGLGLPQLQQIGAEVGHVGGDQFVADQIAIVGGEETLGRAEQIVAEHVVGRQREELLVLHHVVAQQRLADRVDHDGVGDVDVERVLVAVLAA